MSTGDYAGYIIATLAIAYIAMRIVDRLRAWGATGGYRSGSDRIPRLAWIGAAAVVAVFFGLAFVGAAVGF